MTADNSFKYYDGTAWRIIKTPKYYDGTAWRTAKEIKYYTGTSWQTVYLAATVPVITVQPTSQTYTPSAPTITSQPTNQTSNAGTPTFSAQPSNSSVTAGGTATFSVTASSPDSGSLSYQWQRSTDSGANYSNVSTGTGGTTASYTTEATTTGMNGYLYRCVVTNTKTNSVTFSITATAGGTLSYQWYNGAGAISGATSSTYTTSTAANYYCIVTNTQTGNVTFNITATGNGTLGYLWYLNAASTGVTSTSYTTSTASSNIYCLVGNTRNGVTPQQLSNTVTSTTTGTASTTSNTVSATINTTTSANSNAATLTVTAAATNVRPNSFTSDASLAWINSGQTTDIAFGDTTTYGNAGINTNNNTSNYAYMAWAAQATSTATLKLQRGVIAQLGTSGLSCSTTIDYSTNSGTSWTTIETGTESSSTGPTASSISLPAGTNLSAVRVRFGTIKTLGTAIQRSFVQARCWDAYIEYT